MSNFPYNPEIEVMRIPISKKMNYLSDAVNRMGVMPAMVTKNLTILMLILLMILTLLILHLLILPTQVATLQRSLISMHLCAGILLVVSAFSGISTSLGYVVG